MKIFLYSSSVYSCHLYLKLSIGPKKDLNDLDNHNGVITHLEPDIVEFEVKWALGSITTNKTRGNWKILKEMGVPDHLTCPLINLYPDQEATARNGYGTMNWF